MGVKKFYRPILSYDGKMIDGGSGDVPPATDDTVGGVLRAEYVAPVAEGAALEDVITTVNDLLEKLRASGAMVPVGQGGT